MTTGGGAVDTKNAIATDGETTTAAMTVEGATTTAMTIGTSVATVIDGRGGPAAAMRLQCVAASLARMSSMRARLTPRSLSPSREAERTWITPAAGSNQNSVSSTKRNH